MEWCVCVCVCVNHCKKTLVLWDICASGITSRIVPASWKQGAHAHEQAHDGIIQRFDVNLFEWAKITVLTYETARDTLELANNTMLYGLFPAASVGSNFTDWEPPS